MLRNKLAKPFQIFAFILSVISTTPLANGSEEVESVATPYITQLSETIAEHKTPIMVAGVAIAATSIYYLTGSPDTLLPCDPTTILNASAVPGTWQFYVNGTTLYGIVAEIPSKSSGWLSSLFAWLPECYNPALYQTKSMVNMCLQGCLGSLEDINRTGWGCLNLVRCWSNGTTTLICDWAEGAWYATVRALYNPATLRELIVNKNKPWFDVTSEILQRVQYAHDNLSFHSGFREISQSLPLLPSQPSGALVYAQNYFVKCLNETKFWGL